jgi:hypothetical protein
MPIGSPWSNRHIKDPWQRSAFVKSVREEFVRVLEGSTCAAKLRWSRCAAEFRPFFRRNSPQQRSTEH